MSFAIQVSELTCTRADRTLFSQLSFVLMQGQLLVVQGHNGTGKTTLLRCLAGMMPDYHGQVTLADQSPLMIGHSPGISGLLTAAENLAWYAALRGLPRDDNAILEALSRLGLAGFEAQPCQLMSAGQRRRVALARLVLEPAQIWLLDEPSATLDETGTQILWQLCRQHLDQGGTIVVSAHKTPDFTGISQLLWLDGSTHRLDSRI